VKNGNFSILTAVFSGVCYREDTIPGEIISSPGFCDVGGKNLLIGFTNWYISQNNKK